MRYYKVRYIHHGKTHETLTNAEGKQQATNRVWSELMDEYPIGLIKIIGVWEV